VARIALHDSAKVGLGKAVLSLISTSEYPIVVRQEQLRVRPAEAGNKNKKPSQLRTDLTIQAGDCNTEIDLTSPDHINNAKCMAAVSAIEARNCYRCVRAT
jgi:hypothetical protein